VQPVAGGKGGRGGPPVLGENGNWACPGCRNINFGIREACNRCQMPKPEDQINMAYNISTAAGPGGPSAKTANGAPIAGLGGNWKCNMCQNVNFAARDACNRCQAPRSAAEAPSFGCGGGGGGGKMGGGKGKRPVAGENGNWACPGCGNVNFGIRDVCNRCQGPKPEEDAFAQAAFESFEAWGADAGADGSLLDQLLQTDEYGSDQPAKRMKF